MDIMAAARDRRAKLKRGIAARSYFTILLSVLVTAATLESAPSTLAADLVIRPSKRVVVYHRARVVADYDGTPIVLRRVRPLIIGSAGVTAVVRRPGFYDAYAVPGAIPRRYFNGQPIR